MSDKTTGKMPLQAAITQLYGYIYCMILSSMLTDMPIFGGVLYLCGKAVLVFSGTVGRNRKFLPAYAKRWVIAMVVVLLSIGIVLAGLFPAEIQSGKVWMLYAAVALCISAETNTDRLARILRADEAMSGRTKAAGILLQAAILIGMSSIIFFNFGFAEGLAPAERQLVLF